MPDFNSILLYYSASVLDVTRLDSAAYNYSFHVISAAIIIRVSEYPSQPSRAGGVQFKNISKLVMNIYW